MVAGWVGGLSPVDLCVGENLYGRQPGLGDGAAAIAAAIVVGSAGGLGILGDYPLAAADAVM